MKKILFLLISLLSIFQISNAQKNTIIIASVKYKVKYTVDRDVIIDDVCQLDITKKNSFFYSYGFVEMMNALEAKYKRAQESNTPMETSKEDFKTTLYKFYTIKDYNNKKIIITEYFSDQGLGYVRDSLNSTKWEISNEKKTINKLICVKAQTTIGKIKSTVWFCPEIPFQEGPFYYNGLPGLIVKASNSLGWDAELISTNFNRKDNKQIVIWPYTLVTKAQFDKAKINNENLLKSGTIPGGGSFEKANN